MIFDALFEPRQLSTSTPRNPAQWLIDWFNGGDDTAAGISVSQRSALTYSAVWAATLILTDGVASVPCVLFRRRQQREGKDKARDHVLYRVLHDEPNSEMDSCTFFGQQTPFLVNSGNAYAEKERMLSGRIAGLWPLKSYDVNPVRREDGQIEYEVKRDQGGQDIVAAKDMLHVTGVLSEDGITGKGVIKQARESIAMGQATEKYGAGFFGKDCRPGGVLTTDKKLSPEAWNRMKSWSDKHGGFARAHKLGVLEEGTKYQAIGVSPEEAQFLATRQHNITELARWYRVPLHMLAIVLGVPRANIEEEGINLVTYSLRPWWVRYERAYHRQLLTEEEKSQLFVGFNADALLRGDSKSRTESYKNKFAMGAITVNRVLGLEDENEIGPDGDRRFIPMNMIALDRHDDYVDALMKKAAATNSPSQRGPGDGGDQDGDENNDASAVGEVLADVRQHYAEKVREQEQRAAESRDRQIKAASAVLSEAVGRMLVKEAKAATRAAKEPGKFNAWLDGFYDKHGQTFVDAVGPALTAWMTAVDRYWNGQGPDVAIAEMAVGHVGESRRQLLEAAECKPEELVGRVAECVAGWSERVAKAAAYDKEILTAE
jgi:HK97 family phage portal protein